MQKLKVQYNKVVNHFKGDTGKEFIPVLQPGNVQNAEDLIRDAQKVEHLLQEIVRALIHKANETIDITNKGEIKTGCFNMAETKSFDRINHKAKNEYDGNFNDIRDVARGAVKLNDCEKIGALSAVLDWAYKNQVELPGGAMIVVSEDRFTKPLSSGYSSHKVNIAIPIPGEQGRWHIAEVMLMHDKFEKDIKANKRNKFYDNSHEAYEKFRYLEGIANDRPLTREEAEVLGKIQRALNKIHMKAREDNKLDEIAGYSKTYRNKLDKEAFEAFNNEMNSMENETHDL